MTIPLAIIIHRFMGEMAIPLLGQVYDLIGVAEAGYKSDQLNAFVNAKTADKDLQFGHEKCKTMLISKEGPPNKDLKLTKLCFGPI